MITDNCKVNGGQEDKDQMVMEKIAIAYLDLF